MKESEAFSKWCPMAPTQDRYNRSVQNVGSGCMASGCMVWIDETLRDDDEIHGHCGFVK